MNGSLRNRKQQPLVGMRGRGLVRAPEQDEDLEAVARRLGELAVPGLEAHVAYVYAPLRYAWLPHAEYLRRWGRGRREVLLVGMNPGPFGMVQTGVPFGDPTLVRDWLRIDGPVGRPDLEHPRRPVLGFRSMRPEVSGRRLWGWARSRWRNPERFFDRFFVWNYCPLAFLDAQGRNVTPDRLPRRVRGMLEAACDEALARVVEILGPRWVIGIGGYPTRRARHVLRRRRGVHIGTILHPSPASPRANRGWEGIVESQLRALGIEVP
ncbi:MAG: single-stranded DNA-binding protein [Myxococcota bacterium]|nr:single-stranded DNA-binding protein [Myxococcota bacterium]